MSEEERNVSITRSYLRGASMCGLAQTYGLTEHRTTVIIQRVVLEAYRRRYRLADMRLDKWQIEAAIDRRWPNPATVDDIRIGKIPIEDYG